RLFVTRHRDQIIADQATWAACMKLPREDQADLAVKRIVAQYRRSYGSGFTCKCTYMRDRNGLATSIRIDVTDSVPVVFPVLIGATARASAASAGAARTIPPSVLQGLVPLGIQFDQDFDLPPGGSASQNQITLAVDSSGEKPAPGNFCAMDFDGSGVS